MPIKLIYKDPSLNAWLLFRSTYYSIVKCEDELFSLYGITSQQFAVLMALRQAPEPVTQTDIANWLDRDPTSVTAIIDNMSKKGLVERFRDLKDRRSTRLVITHRGEEILGMVRVPHGIQRMEIMSCLSEKEILTLSNLLDKIRDKTFEYRKIDDNVTEYTPVTDNEEKFPWPAPK